MNRRESLFALLVLSRAPAAFAQSPRRLGVLMTYAETDAEAKRRLKAFTDALAERGWKEGSNFSMEVRWTGGGDPAAAAKALLARKPDILFTGTTPGMAALYGQARSIPIVFTALASDPVANGWVKSLGRPGGSATGLIQFEEAMAQKWVQLLKEMAPRVKRVAVIFNPATAPYAEKYLKPLQSMAPKLGVQISTAPIAAPADIEKVVAGLAHTPGSALVGMSDSFILANRKAVIDAAAHHKLPTIFFSSIFAEDGALAGYGPDTSDLYRRAAPYVDTILRGANPAELPVERPTKFEFAINKKTAKALGLTIPPPLLVRADRLIE